MFKVRVLLLGVKGDFDSYIIRVLRELLSPHQKKLNLYISDWVGRETINNISVASTLHRDGCSGYRPGVREHKRYPLL